MNNGLSDKQEKSKARDALTINKVKFNAIKKPSNSANKKVQQTQKTRG